MNELANFFEELQERYELLKVQNKKFKNKNDVLINKINEISKEKDFYLFLIKMFKRILTIIRLLAKLNFLVLIKKSFLILKKELKL